MAYMETHPLQYNGHGPSVSLVKWAVPTTLNIVQKGRTAKGNNKYWLQSKAPTPDMPKVP